MDTARKRPFIGAIDQGTSSSRFLVNKITLLNKIFIKFSSLFIKIFAADTGELITYDQIEINPIYPKEG